jgi:uncharacterized protein YbcC (UPF0753/DUF2309 family)
MDNEAESLTEDGPEPGHGHPRGHHGGDHLEGILYRVGHLLPEQNPLEAFVHHNTLHAYEHLPFEGALQAASAELGTAAAMPEAFTRAQLRSGRILSIDLDETLADRVPDLLLPGLQRSQRELVRRVTLAGLHEAAGPTLAWHLSESNVLDVIAEGVPAEARDALRAQGPAPTVLRALWAAAQALPAPRAAAPEADPAGLRARDRLVQAGLPDPDPMVHQALIRWCGAYLDTGHAYWPMMERSRSFFRGFLLHAASAKDARAWLSGAQTLAQGLLHRPGGAPTAEQVVAEELRRLQVAPDQEEDLIRASLLALRGWGGMFHRLEHRPDLWPHKVAEPRLVDLLAVRLLLDRLAADHLLDQAGLEGGPTGQRLLRLPRLAPPPAIDAAWVRFQVACLLGLSPAELRELSGERLAACDAAVALADGHHRRLYLQEAYERSYRRGILDAVARHWPLAAPTPRADRASAQLVLCIDDREESFRRHLEEIDPSLETFGMAGFFGVAMRYRALGGAKSRPLCPAPVTPQHSVEEVVVEDEAAAREASAVGRARSASVQNNLSTARDTLLRGSILSLAGWLTLFPMATALLSPRLYAKWTAKAAPPRTRLKLLRVDPEARDADGLFRGFTVEEMVGVVAKALEDIGLTTRLSRLVVWMGHGSHSANNPHRAAYDCGATGGGHGGPNARAIAAMANLRAVREGLKGRGISIPDDTFFLGAHHDTCDDRVDWLDLDLLPASHLAEHRALVQTVDTARARNAHERARRFMSAPLDLSAEQALAHVQARSEDLAQPRPELGHATNAIAIVGRRHWSRGLFLDRRSFLVSYDPTIDPEITILSRILAAVGPVGAGINLEYFFSFIDPALYGCGTKLPHNVTGFLGVMDGYSSDLRTGLPWQMVEIHEPMRLLLIIEATTEALGVVLERHPPVAQLVLNRWVQVASIHPDTGKIKLFTGARWEDWSPPPDRLPEVRSSAEWYAGQRGHLPPATITDGLPRPARTR